MTSASVLRCFGIGWLTQPCFVLCFSLYFAVLLLVLRLVSTSQSFGCILPADLAMLFLPAVGNALLPAVGFALLPAVGFALLPAVGFALLPAVGFALLGSFHPFSPARQ